MGFANWRKAAEYVERYRTDNCITDEHRALGPEPKGVARILWRIDTRHLETVTGRARDPTPEVDLGAELA
jgi:hypothetical protein